MKIKCFAALGILLFILLAVYPVRALEVPEHQGFVTDLTGFLSKQQEQTLEDDLQKYNAGSHQIAVLIIKSLEGTPIETYSVDVFEKWGVGRAEINGKKADTGVLLLISIKDRETRIAPGYGVEGVLPDGRCGETIRKMNPYFKKGDYYGGISTGIGEIKKALAGEYTAEDLESQNKEREKEIRNLMLFKLGAYAVIALILLMVLGAIQDCLSPKLKIGVKIIPGLLGSLFGWGLTKIFYGGFWRLLIASIIGVVLGIFAKSIAKVIMAIAEAFSSSSSGGSSGGYSGGYRSSSGAGNSSRNNYGSGHTGGGGATGKW